MGFFRNVMDEALRQHNARKEAASAMDLYKRQQADAQKSIEERKAQQAIQQRAINEKQIRSLRASFRRPGIMVAPPPGQQATSAQAGGVMQPMDTGMSK